MSRKILAILLALLTVAALCACGNGNKKGDDENNTINLPGNESESGESGSEIGSGNIEIGDPGEYTYTECDQAVYVNNPDSAVTLRSATYEAKGSVAHGTELRRIGLSNDSANYWSKVLHNDQEYYVASKFLTTLKNPDEGFVAVDKIVVVNEQTGSLNIRNLPSFEGSAIIGWALAGVETKVIAENTETGWYKIEFVPYGSTEKAIGYIKSGKDNFVQEATSESEAGSETVDESSSENTSEDTSESTSESATEASGK